MKPKIRVIIPARLASSRLPRKALLDIAGKPMLQHVYELAQKSEVDSIVIATDSIEIEQHAKAFGAEVCMTASHHSSGTERIGEVIQHYQYDTHDIIVNVQCDVPLLSPILIKQVADSLLEKNDAVMATLYEPFQDKVDIFNPNYVKVVVDAKGYAIMFSRAPIPYYREGFVLNSAQQSTVPQDFQYLHHIGLYAYRAGFVQKYLSWPESRVENIECLEQLRVLYYGEKICLTQAKAKPGQGVDTAEDLEKVRALMRKI